MGLPTHCLPFPPKFSRHSFMIQKSFENPQFSSGHLEGSFVNFNGNVAATNRKTFRQKSKLLHKNLEENREKDFSENLVFVKLFLCRRILLFWIICRKRRPKSWKNQKLFFCKKLLYFSTRSLIRQNRSFSLKSFHYFNRHLSRNRRAEKMPLLACRLLWIIEMVFSDKFIKWKEIFLYRLRFSYILANYTASCTILEIHNFKSRNIWHQNLADCLRLIAIVIVRFLKYIRKICF